MGEWQEILDQKMVERFGRETQRTEKDCVGAKTECSEYPYRLVSVGLVFVCLLERYKHHLLSAWNDAFYDHRNQSVHLSWRCSKACTFLLSVTARMYVCGSNDMSVLEVTVV